MYAYVSQVMQQVKPLDDVSTIEALLLIQKLVSH